MKAWTVLAAIGAFAAVIPAAAHAQGSAELATALRAGQIGERFDGYLGISGRPSPAVVREVRAINIRRRALYTDLARRRGVTPEVAGFATGCELLGRTQIGQAYLLQDGVWRRRDLGEPPPRPGFCG